MVEKRLVDPCGQRTTHADGARPSANLASSQKSSRARDSGCVEETQTAEEAEGENGRKGRRERQNKRRSEDTLHMVLHLPNNATTATATATATAAAAATAAMRVQ